MDTLIRDSKILESKEQLLGVFKSGFNDKKRLGVEFEKLPVRNSDGKSVEFFYKNGILDFITEYKNEMHGIPTYESQTMLGVINNAGNLTLEPGCQVEMSLRPVEKISDIERELTIYNAASSKIADIMGISFIALGCQPVSTYDNIKIIPKERYEFMTKFLFDKGSLPFVMMRETAGIQTSIDYKDEEDAINKLSLALKLSPFISAFFANSPIRGGKLSGYKSFRLNAWLNTDNKRCGLISKRLIENPQDFSFEDYAEILLDVPMIFNGSEFVGNKTFRELFNENKATSDAWSTHLSLFFPDVRLKNYIEIRNHDCQLPSFALAVPALYKGIFYSAMGMKEVKEILKDFTYYDFEFVRQNAPRFGADFSVKNKKVFDIIKEIFLIAQKGLTEFDLGEEKYLDKAFELLEGQITPADVIIKNFEGSWKRNIKKLLEYSKIN